MPKSVNPIPSDSAQISPILVVRNGKKAIEFYQKAFGAEEVTRMDTPDGKIGHADLQIGKAHVMLCDEAPEMDARSPDTIGGSPVALYLYVEDVDDVVARALKAGATAVEAVEDKFYGDRAGRLRDPFGHTWWVATRKENVSPAELKRRAAEMYEAQPS